MANIATLGSEVHKPERFAKRNLHAPPKRQPSDSEYEDPTKGNHWWPLLIISKKFL